MKNKYFISSVFFLLGLAFLFLPMTYYGFIDYIVQNTIINMNIGKDTLETEKAAIAIYNGAGLTFAPKWMLNVLTVVGLFLVYLALVFIIIGKEVITKEYWTTFRIRP